MTYRPLPEHLTIKESTIEGLGLYSTESLTQARFLGVSHVPNDKFENGYIRTPLGGFINHSDDPNCYITTDRGDRTLHIIKPISAGEEMTVFYRFKGYDGIVDGEDPDKYPNIEE